MPSGSEKGEREGEREQREPGGGRHLVGDELEHVGLEIERFAEIAVYGLTDPFGILDEKRAIEPIGLTDRLDAFGARVFARERHRDVTRCPQQQEGERRHRDRHQDGEAQPLQGVGEHRDLYFQLISQNRIISSG
jgi:hypothetical protein